MHWPLQPPFFFPSSRCAAAGSPHVAGRGRTPSLKSLVFTVGRENHQGLSLAASPPCRCAGGWQMQGTACTGPPRLRPFQREPGESTVLCLQPPSLGCFLILKAI